MKDGDGNLFSVNDKNLVYLLILLSEIILVPVRWLSNEQLTLFLKMLMVRFSADVTKQFAVVQYPLMIKSKAKLNSGSLNYTLSSGDV